MSPWRRVEFMVCLVLAASARAEAPAWLEPGLRQIPAGWAPAADIVRLLDSDELTYVSADKATSVIRVADRVISDSGRARARVSFLHNADVIKIVSVRAWVISADGRKIKAYGRSDFSDQVAQYDSLLWDSQRIASFDASDKVETGSILAWEIRTESQAGIFDSGWSFRDEIPVLHSVFTVTPPADGRLEWHATSARIPRPLAGSSPGALTWRMDRVGILAIGQPAGFIPNPLSVVVRCIPAGQPGATWASMARQVSEVVEPRILISPDLKARAQAIAEGKSARWERIRALAEFVQRTVSYLSVTVDHDYLAGCRPHLPSEVLQNRYGDCKDKAALMVAMLRAIGDDGHVMLVYARNPRAVIPAWPSADFNHAIVVIPADSDVPASWPVVDAGELGRMVVFDPTDPATPLGALSLGDQGGFGLIVSPRQTDLVKLPADDASRPDLVRTIKANLGQDGMLAATVEETWTGAKAGNLYLNLSHARADAANRLLAARLHAKLPSVHDVKFTDEWNSATASLLLNFSFSASRFGQRMGAEGILFDPQLLGDFSPLPAWRAVQEGVTWFPAQSAQSETRLALPPGFKVDGIPDDWTKDEGGFSCRIRYSAEGNELVCRVRVVQQPGFIDRRGYDVLFKAYQAAYEALRRPVILRNAQPQSQPRSQ